MKKSPQKTVSPQQKLKKQIYQRDQLQKIVEHYAAAGKLETQAAKKVISHVRSLNRIINNKNKYNHKVVEVRREAVYKPIIHTEKEKLIQILQEELDYLIHSLDTYNPDDFEERRIAKLDYKSYLNIQVLLRELVDTVKSWDTKYYGNANRYTFPTLEGYREFASPQKKRIMNVLGWECSTCGALRNLQIHHVVPLAEGGDSLIGNLTILCKKHHKAIHEEIEVYKTERLHKNSLAATFEDFVRVEQEA